MQLSDYLDRINYAGTLKVDLETLRELHRAHLMNIPYENFDIHLGHYLSLDEQQIFDKLVQDGRGGWCYEMNTLFAWALREIGFPVTMLASAVGRTVSGDQAERNHLILTVTLDQPYLVDVGFGNGIFEPIPIQVGSYTQRFLTYQLTYDGNRWYFQNHEYGGTGFDFTLEPRQLSDFTDKCHELQTSTESHFVQTTVAFRFTPDGIVMLRGAVLQVLTPDGWVKQVIEDCDSFQTVLNTQFGLTFDNIPALWEKIWASHLEWVSSQK